MKAILKRFRRDFPRRKDIKGVMIEGLMCHEPSHLIVSNIVRWLVNCVACGLFGHKLQDLDPGNPEVGPQPAFWCRRCWRNF